MEDLGCAVHGDRSRVGYSVADGFAGSTSNLSMHGAESCSRARMNIIFTELHLRAELGKVCPWFG